MKAIMIYLREFNAVSVVVRLLLAVLAGGALGYGRSQKQRNAGLCTYMLVSIGAALTLMISAYEGEMLFGQWAWLTDVVDVKFDGTRYAAQVISGIGFLAAGTIIGTDHQQVTGLTSAIGLFAAAALGIAAGAGFYEGGILAAGTVLMVEIYGSDLGHSIRHNPEFHISLRYQDKAVLDDLLRYCKDNRFSIHNLQVRGTYGAERSVFTAIIDLHSRKFSTMDMLIDYAGKLDGILFIGETEEG